MGDASPALASRSVAELRAALDAGDSCRFLTFWGHRLRRAGDVDRACLSQWFPVAFSADGEDFGSAEQYMMWRKATLFGDLDAAAAVLAARSAAHAKALGREVRGFDEDTWVRHRWDVVVAASLHKFRADARLADFLRSTRGRVLVEASPLDRIWGVGLAADDPTVSEPHVWPGLNLLGFALMEARAAL